MSAILKKLKYFTKKQNYDVYFGKGIKVEIFNVGKCLRFGQQKRLVTGKLTRTFRSNGQKRPCYVMST